MLPLTEKLQQKLRPGQANTRASVHSFIFIFAFISICSRLFNKPIIHQPERCESPSQTKHLSDYTTQATTTTRQTKCHTASHAESDKHSKRQIRHEATRLSGMCNRQQTEAQIHRETEVRRDPPRQTNIPVAATVACHNGANMFEILDWLQHTLIAIA